jgi:sugar phosphate isomerase/epimerase
MIKTRQELVEPCIAAVKKSLFELLAYAGNSGICLGLENRYHFFDLPSPDEMALFLDLADSDQLGFIYDTGHAHAMDRLGFYPHNEWLQRFSDRIIGTHLHDAIGIQDHLAPGLGEINFITVANSLPNNAFRTLEIKSLHSIEEVRKGLVHLVDTGCIHPV